MTDIVIAVQGNDLSGLYNESGGHRIQRVSPTEKRGRVHSSTVVVAVYDKPIQDTSIKDSDIRVEWFSGTGNGGQHRNKHQNSCKLVHVPTSITAMAQTRSRKSSMEQAMAALTTRILQSRETSLNHEVAENKKQQFGSGMRGDKVRTYRFQDDIAKDHRTEKSTSCRKILSGNMDLLW